MCSARFFGEDRELMDWSNNQTQGFELAAQHLLSSTHHAEGLKGRGKSALQRGKCSSQIENNHALHRKPTS